jgi:transposase-like protein
VHSTCRGSVSLRRRGGFQPPHCPNPDCPFHQPHPDWRFARAGFFVRPSDQRRFQIFRCRQCRRHFSSRTFATTYWLRRRNLLRQVAAWSVEAPGLRQMGRVLGASPATIARHLARLGRHCLLFHEWTCAGPTAPGGTSLAKAEPFVIDGFESFEYSQYFPFHLNLAIGAKSHFIYTFNQSPLRRKGRMTPFQRLRRAELEARLGRPDPRAIERAFGALVRELLPRCRGRLVLHTDEHPGYERGLRRLARELKRAAIDHHTTSARARRTPRNPLFPVNLADLLLRHGGANHRRETIAFSKRRQAACERAAVFLVWRNYIKRWSETGRDETTAMKAGVLDRPLDWGTVLRQRLFRAHRRLSEEWNAIYERRIATLAYGRRQTRHACRYAF